MISGIGRRSFARPQRRAIDTGLERRNAQASNCVDEPFVGFTLLDVDVDQPRDDIGHVVRLERWPDDLADGAAATPGMRSIGAADRNLVPLFAVLVDAENADVPGVMMTAGIHATGNIDV